MNLNIILASIIVNDCELTAKVSKIQVKRLSGFLLLLAVVKWCSNDLIECLINKKAVKHYHCQIPRVNLRQQIGLGTAFKRPRMSKVILISLTY